MRPGRRVAVIGLGLIGGSLAWALRRSGAYTVYGYDAAPQAVRQALARHAIDEGCASLEAAARAANLAVFCLPVRRIAATVAQVAPLLAPRTVVTDVASTKGELLATLPALLPPGVAYVGGHPMAGSEKSGFAAARPDLFAGHPYILTRHAGMDKRALRRVVEMVRHIGAVPVLLDGAAHDGIAAEVSHVPHLLAAALTMLAGRGPHADVKMRLTAGGFRDMTRIAASEAALWTDICLSNRREITAGLRKLELLMEELIAALEHDDAAGLHTFLQQASGIRRRLAADITTDKEDEHAHPPVFGRFARYSGRARRQIHLPPGGDVGRFGPGHHGC